MNRAAHERLLLGLGLVALLLAACGPAEDGATDSDAAATARTYQVRGRLQAVTVTPSGAGQLRIHHEAIPDLVGQSGEVEGMMPMSMQFPVADEMDLTVFAAGDPVLFELRIDWEAARPAVITAMEKLPAETELAID